MGEDQSVESTIRCNCTCLWMKTTSWLQLDSWSRNGTCKSNFALQSEPLFKLQNRTNLYYIHGPNSQPGKPQYELRSWYSQSLHQGVFGTMYDEPAMLPERNTEWSSILHARDIFYKQPSVAHGKPGFIGINIPRIGNTSYHRLSRWTEALLGP